MEDFNTLFPIYTHIHEVILYALLPLDILYDIPYSNRIVFNLIAAMATEWLTGGLYIQHRYIDKEMIHVQDKTKQDRARFPHTI